MSQPSESHLPLSVLSQRAQEGRRPRCPGRGDEERSAGSSGASIAAMVARARFGPDARGPAGAVGPLRVAAVAGLVVLAGIGFQLAERRIGVGLSSDAYSYLAWAERVLAEGELGHTGYEFRRRSRSRWPWRRWETARERR